MSQKKPAPIGFRFFSGSSLGSVLDRPRKKLSRFVHGEGNENHDGLEDESEATQAAHARRREQVRRAQRNHRERKENYIKSLEHSLLQFCDEVTLRQEFEEANLENKILKEIMVAHNLTVPQLQTQAAGIAEVSMVGTPGPSQYLRVRMPSSSASSAGQKEIASQQDTSSTKLASHLVQIAVSSPSAPNTASTTEPSAQSLGSRPHQRQHQHQHPHPQGLDTSQTGIDFVLSLEQPCLEHTYHPIRAGEAHGHALTLQAALLSHGPNLGAEPSWDMPMVELDRLLELSAALDLDGELTPVQAWNLIKSHPNFLKLTPDGLRVLRAAIAQKIKCYGFGASSRKKISDPCLTAILTAYRLEGKLLAPFR